VRRARAHLALVAVAACSGGGATCPNDQPQSCPGPAPSYATDISLIVDGTCSQCHVAGGSAANKPLGTYAEVYQRRLSVLTQLTACLMPPPSSGISLTAQERADLLAWLVCGAPNN
jgi:hypothetical protein